MQEKIEILRTGDVYHSENLFGYSGWPTVAKLEDGRLIATFSAGRIAHVCPFGKTVACYSYDEGKTWTAPFAVADTPFDDRDGGICVRGKQVLITTFNNTYSFQREENARRNDSSLKDVIEDYIKCNENADNSLVGSWVYVSEDGGNVFDKRYRMPITNPHGPILLSDGRYFYVGRSFSVDKNYLEEGVFDKFLPEGLYCCYSTDGYEWTEPESIPFEPQNDDLWCEPHAFEKKDGTISVMVRVQKLKNGIGPMRTYQIDQTADGKWAKPVDLGILASPPHIIRHSSGALILVVGRRVKPYAQQALISRDDGKTWSEPIDIDTRTCSDDHGYPSSVELSDGSVLTAFYQREKPNEKNRISYVVWRLA